MNSVKTPPAAAESRPYPAGTRPSDQFGAGEAAWLHLREYSKEHPEVVALWTFGVGFVLGWKLKPW